MDILLSVIKNWTFAILYTLNKISQAFQQAIFTKSRQLYDYQLPQNRLKKLSKKATCIYIYVSFTYTYEYTKIRSEDIQA